MTDEVKTEAAPAPVTQTTHVPLVAATPEVVGMDFAAEKPVEGKTPEEAVNEAELPKTVQDERKAGREAIEHHKKAAEAQSKE